MRTKSSSARLRVEPLEDRTLMSTCHVTRLTNHGIGNGLRGDLRYCIAQTNAIAGQDQISFNVTGTIDLTGRLPDLTDDLIVDGPGAQNLTIRRASGGDYRIITNHARVTLSGLTISNGRENNGGGIFNDYILTLTDCVVADNEATATGVGVYGGGVYNAHHLIVRKSVISNNTAQGTTVQVFGGGIYNEGHVDIRNSTIRNNEAIDGTSVLVNSGGGVFNLESMYVYNSAISGNSAEQGGGVYNDRLLLVRNSTLSGNQAMYGGGLYTHWNPTGQAQVYFTTIANNQSFSGAGIFVGNDPDTKITLGNTLVANNSAPNHPDLSGPLSPFSPGHNLFGNSSGGSGYAPTDILNVNPKMGSLQDNGGLSWTHALMPDSPAVNAASSNILAPAFDQRGPGFPRVVDGSADIGAFEVQGTGAPTITPLRQLPRIDVRILSLTTADFDTEK